MDMVSASTIISFLSMPYVEAIEITFSAIRIRSCTVSGIPFSSRQSTTTAAPYFFTNGSILSRDSFLPFTEFNNGLPL